MREARVWEWLLHHSPDWLAVERIEALFPPGLADCFWTDMRDGRSGWLELKYCDPKNIEFLRGRIPKLRPEQPMFLARQVRKNVPAGILLRVGSVGMNKWYVWKASSNREWINQVRGPDAIYNATASWTNSDPKYAPTVEEIITVLRGDLML